MKVGFTGTRHGLAGSQEDAVYGLLQELRPDEGHHGDCVGADEAFHRMCRTLLIPVVIHPPKDPKLRAWCEGAIEVRPPAPYLKRNRQIVKETDVLIATPGEDVEPAPGEGGGTWYTVHYARRRDSDVYEVWPSGLVLRGTRT